MTILSEHVYDSAWTREAQARYTRIIKQYPYIPPETQYTTGLPTPGGMTAREACQSAAEEALFADYRPLRAGFVEDHIGTVDSVEGQVAFDIEHGVVHAPVSREQLIDLLKIFAGFEAQETHLKKSGSVVELTSTRRKQRIRMKNHKRRKL
jgi:hypothetical protein